MIYVEPDYGMVTARRIGPEQTGHCRGQRFKIPLDFNACSAISEYENLASAYSRRLISSHEIVGALYKAREHGASISDRVELSRLIAYLCFAQDSWIGAIGLRSIVSARKFCEALLEHGGDAELHIPEDERNPRVFIGNHPPTSIFANGLNMARIMGWVKVIPEKAETEPARVYFPGQYTDRTFIEQYTRRRENRSNQLFGLAYLKKGAGMK